MTTTAQPTVTTTVNPPAPTTPDTTGNPLVAEVDTLIRKLDGSVKFTRDTAKEIGGILTRIKAELFNGNVGRFNVWFVGRYHRTAQSAAQWIRLAAVWDDCRTAYDADTTPDKEPWDRLSIIETLALVAVKRTPSVQTPEQLATEKKKAVAEARKTLAESGEPFFGGPMDDDVTISPELEAFAVKVFTRMGTVVRVKAGRKIKIGNQTLTITGPVVIMPEDETNTEGD